MTRDDQIYEAANNYSVCEYNQTIEQNAFINGAKWADRNTILSWISVEDSLPRQDEEVIVLCDKLNASPMYEIGFAHIVNRDKCKDFNGWNIPGVKYWFPMPVLQKQH